MSVGVDLDRLLDLSRPVECEGTYRSLLENGPWDPEFELEIHCLIGRTLGLQGRFDEATAELDLVESRLKPEFSRARVRLDLERGRVLNSSGDPESSKSFFTSAFGLAESSRLAFLAVDAAHMMAIVCRGDEMVDWSCRALALIDASPDFQVKGWKGAILNNRGWSYFEAGQLELALADFKAAVEVRRDGPTRPFLIANYAVARALRALDRFEEALRLGLWLEAENATIGSPAPFVQEELGECYLVLGSPTEAAIHFAKAYEAFTQLGLIANEPDRLARMKELSAQLS